MLGDCGSRKVLRTAYRFQVGDAPTPPTIIQTLWPAFARPYAWAKARLSGSGK